jgi:hypothetical protein
VSHSILLVSVRAALEKRCEFSELPVTVQAREWFKYFKTFKSFKLFKPNGVRAFGGAPVPFGKYATRGEAGR